MPTTRIDRIIERHDMMKREKQPWLPMYQLIGEYVMTRKQYFTSDSTPGEIQTEHIYDNTAVHSNHLMSAALLGALWPNTAKSIKIIPPPALEDFESPIVKEWYEESTRIMVDAMDHPKSGLTLALEEYMNDLGSFGIAGIGAFDNDDFEVPVSYQAFDAKVVTIDEGANGFIDTTYIEKEITIRQAAQEFGLNNLSSESRKKYLDGKGNEKIKILHAIEPRFDRDPYKFGAKDMPIGSIHIELGHKKILRESGFAEQPLFVPRFWKVMGEKYGRSPAMAAIPDIIEVNALREAYALAIEKNLDPPLTALSDSIMGNGYVDTSPGALNVISVSGRLAGANIKPLEPLFTTGELQSAQVRINEIRETIGNHFFIDRLLDFNNETRMTLGEAQLRNQFRSESLGTLYSRQIAELFQPLVQRTFNILFRKGYFGVIEGTAEEAEFLLNGITPRYIPQEVVTLMGLGQEAYRIKFISPATRILQSEELRGIITTLESGQSLANVAPEALDRLDGDEIVLKIAELSGAPPEIVRDMQTVQKLRQAREQMQAQAAQIEQAKAGSEAARNLAQAEQMAS